MVMGIQMGLRRVGAILFSGVLIAGLQSSVAHAYIPPSQFIIKNWLAQHPSTKRWKAKFLVTAYEKNQPTALRFKEILVFAGDHKQIKSTALNDEDQVLYYQERGISTLSPAFKLLLSSEYVDVMRTLKDRNIPVRSELDLQTLETDAERYAAEQESLVKWNQGLAWAIAPKPRKMSDPQIWFEKDTFRWVKQTYVNASDRKTYEFQIGTDGYRVFQDFTVPKTILVLRKAEEPILSIQLLEIGPDSDSPKKAKTFESGFSSAGKEASSDLRSLLSLYFEVLR